MSDLQSKLGGGLNILQDSLQQGKQKLQTAQEISQYKKVLNDLSEARANLLLKLGEDTYRKIRSGELQDQTLGEYSQGIAEVDRKIFTSQKTLEQLNQASKEGTCSNCGNSITPDDKFCGSCGQKQETYSELTNQVNMVTCPTCEEQIPADANFCACCGSRLVLQGV
ncbi:zinc ribbon domain-containing protein [Bacillus sp. JJ1764]|uniref:zinc ribbon domain-containing protein n=1 Tax=Bacillus sp. JJ1764 TaxID=3122964 RepID=UPI002FFDBF68